MSTKTAVIVLCIEAVLIYAIPPLSPQPINFYDDNPTHVPPLFKIPFPNDTVLPSDFIKWKTISSWYFGSSQPLYFDMLCRDSKLHRFKIILEPDLSTASLHVIKTSELTPLNFDNVFLQDYKICEDTLVSCWFVDARCFNTGSKFRWQWGVYTGSMSTRFSNVTSNGSLAAKMLLPESLRRLFFCPASGRFVHQDIRFGDVAVLDVF